jgi:hypothetical protein
MIIVLAKAEKKVDLEDEVEILTKVRQELKNDPTVKKIFQEHGKDMDYLDGIPIDISDEIDVSAKTINSRVILNKRLLNEPFEILMRYAVHELVHALQHMESAFADDPYSEHEYLDRPDELEAFQYQIEYDKNNRGENEVVEYVEELLDYHDIPEHEQEEKKDELLERT